MFFAWFRDATATEAYDAFVANQAHDISTEIISEAINLYSKSQNIIIEGSKHPGRDRKFTKILQVILIDEKYKPVIHNSFTNEKLRSKIISILSKDFFQTNQFFKLSNYNERYFFGINRNINQNRKEFIEETKNLVMKSMEIILKLDSDLRSFSNESVDKSTRSNRNGKSRKLSWSSGATVTAGIGALITDEDELHTDHDSGLSDNNLNNNQTNPMKRNPMNATRSSSNHHAPPRVDASDSTKQEAQNGTPSLSNHRSSPTTFSSRGINDSKLKHMVNRPSGSENRKRSSRGRNNSMRLNRNSSGSNRRQPSSSGDGITEENVSSSDEHSIASGSDSLRLCPTASSLSGDSINVAEGIVMNTSQSSLTSDKEKSVDTSEPTPENSEVPPVTIILPNAQQVIERTSSETRYLQVKDIESLCIYIAEEVIIRGKRNLSQGYQLESVDVTVEREFIDVFGLRLRSSVSQKNVLSKCLLSRVLLDTIIDAFVLKFSTRYQFFINKDALFELDRRFQTVGRALFAQTFQEVTDLVRQEEFFLDSGERICI